MNPWHEGIEGLAQLFAMQYKRNGKVFVSLFLDCKSYRTISKEIVGYYRKELIRRPECIEYAKKFNTDQQTLGDILSLIYYILN